MQIKKWLSFICIVIPIFSFSQSLTSNELHNLQGNFFRVLSFQDHDDSPGRVSEFFECFLSVDSSGRISSVHLLADDKNKGVVYNILSRMTIKAFKDWRAESCKNRTLIVPIISLASKKGPAYISSLEESYTADPDKFSSLSVVNETRTAIMLNGYLHRSPL